MSGLIPVFGIEGYGQRLEWLLEAMPRQMALIEASTLGVLGLASLILLGIALTRQSAIAAVSFSFSALTALIVAMMFGRLDFVTSGTQVLILGLYLSSLLLFLTATVRMARDNAVIGLIVLVAIAGLLVLGGASMLQIINGWPILQVAIGATAILMVLFLLIEFLRGDKGSIAVTPGLLLLVATLPSMSFAAERSTGENWLVTISPLLLMTGGVLLAVLAAQLTATAPRAKPKRTKTQPSYASPMAAPATVATAAAAAATAGPVLREMGEEEGAHQDSPHPMTAQPMPSPSKTDEREARPLPTFETTRPQTSADAEPPSSGRDRFGELSEPVSAQWGGGNYAQREIPVADDEYVWDMMADREVRMGSAFARMMNISGGVVASPDILRDQVSEQSLSEFDETILGGFDPHTGRFDVRLTMQDGRVLKIEGRRQLDHDGLMNRLELNAQELSGPAPLPKSTAAPAPSSLAAQANASRPVAEKIDDAPLAAPARSGLAAAAAPALAATKEEPLMAAGGGSEAVAALDRGEIGAWFQPIIRLKDRKTVGFEALARWETPSGEVKDAQFFVDDLIKADRGPDLARIVIDKAAEELAAWMKAEPGGGQFVSVNIAATDLPKETIAEAVKSAVLRFDLPAGALVVELTEGRIQASHSKALASAKAIRNAGASLAVDDFGVGYSTLSRLSKFRFDMVKLDKSLIADLPGSKKQRSVVRAMLSTAEKSGAPVVAEGVETEEVAQLLMELGCDFGQGFLFGAAERIGGGSESTGPTPPSPRPGQAGDLR